MKTRVQRVFVVSEEICREYATSKRGMEKGSDKTDWGREREKMKEMLLPFVKETVKKQLKEEREYYKSRPSLAAKQAESILGAGNIENALVRGMAGRVYAQMEEHMRYEWIRKGGG